MNERAKNQRDRKKDHIELASESQIEEWQSDKRFYYEPLIGVHGSEISKEFPLFNKALKFPLWVSSMTGGTPEARKINENLARACKRYGLGMGLGSCRALLENPNTIKDFDLREHIGDQPFFANLGISQIEKELHSGSLSRIEDMLGKLQADGIIIHVNPLQEFIQPEGDEITKRPIDTIEAFIAKLNVDMIVKEVGQGIGPESLKLILQLPVVLEFAAFGGTNFSRIESNRLDQASVSSFTELATVGHTMNEMIEYINKLISDNREIRIKGVIASGGIKSYLDGYYAIQALKTNAIYGQASGLLKHARNSYESLDNYVQDQIRGYALAGQFLKIRK